MRGPVDPTRRINPNWTILTPKSDKAAYSLDIQVVGVGFGRVIRVDSDLLPEGSIGTVEVADGAVEVTSSVVSGREVLRVVPKSGSTPANSVNTSVEINLAPNVDVMDIATFPAADLASPDVSNNLNKTFPDDAVTLFVNGTGDFFVLTNASVVYVAAFTFRQAGLGRAQVQLGEIGGLAGIMTARAFYIEGTSLPIEIGFTAVIETTKMCTWSESGSSRGYIGTDDDGKPCTVQPVPTKRGGSPAASGPNSSEKPPSGKASAATSVAACPLCTVLTAAIVLAATNAL